MADSSPLEVVLSRLKKTKRSGDQWIACCPAHEDGKPSLSVTTGDDGRVLLNCFAGCEQATIAEAIGLDLRDLFTDGGMGPPSGGGGPDIVQRYPYYDESGTLLYEAVRLVPKDFRQRKPDGLGGWSWSTRGVRRVPYQLPAVIEAVREGRWVVVTEGEKDANRLTEIGFTATTNVGGAGKWGEELNAPFRGAKILVVPDNDEPGRRHAESVAGQLASVASEVRLLELPDLPEKGDVSDWLDSGGDAGQLKALAAKAPVWMQSWERRYEGHSLAHWELQS